MNIQVIGLGYVGLPTALLLAHKGHDVLGVDIDTSKLQNIESGKVNLEDDRINEILKSVLLNRKFKVSEKVYPSDTFILAVPTPIKSREMDLRYLKSACEEVSKVLQNGNLVIIESTITPGTCLGLVKDVLESSGLKAGVDFLLSHVPERVQPSNLYNELVGNDRIIGGYDDKSSSAARKIYETFVEGNIIEVDLTTAEIAKVAENSYRDINIAFANELLLICEKLNVDPWKVIETVNYHPRVNVLKPGPGVGGHCIPVDPWFLYEIAPELAKLVESARERNNYMPVKVAKDIHKILQHIKGSTVAFLGCTYKENSSDDRESQTKQIIESLHGEISYKAFDPHLTKQWSNTYEQIESALDSVDLIVLVVAHEEFTQITPEVMSQLTLCRVIFDCTNTYEVTQWQQKGFTIVRLGENKDIKSIPVTI